jgi:hypothetical protein
MTPYGQVEAEVWASQRTGSNRVTKTWHAASLGYVPVQAIQYRKGKPEVQMKLVRLQRQANQGLGVSRTAAIRTSRGKPLDSEAELRVPTNP